MTHYRLQCKKKKRGKNMRNSLHTVVFFFVWCLQIWPELTSLAFANPDKDKEPISENTTSTGHSVEVMLKNNALLCHFSSIN